MMRRAFTLVELLVSISIIGILAGLILGAMAVSAEHAREARTRTIIHKIDAAIQVRWESYRTRRLSLDIPAYLTANGIAVTPQNVATYRLAALRETMRMELPDCWADVTTPPSVLAQRPALSARYEYRYNQSPPSAENEAAECLYLLCTSGSLEDDPLTESNMRHEDSGDEDQDGWPEFHDGWGRPIAFFRWAPGFSGEWSDLQPDPSFPDVTTFAREYHDPFDPSRSDMPTVLPRGFRLFPLVYSPGSDGEYQLYRADDSADVNDPYYYPSSDAPTGTPMMSGITYGSGFVGTGGFVDNIHNHRTEVR